MPGTTEGLAWLSRAGDGLNRTVAVDAKEGYGFSIVSAKALLELANMPVYTELINGQPTPTVEAMTEAYANGLEIGETFIQWANFYLNEERRLKDSGRAEEAQSLIGCTSEVAVLTLLHRYAISSIRDGSWFALPAMLGEDYHTDDLGGENNWDLGVYTQWATEEQSELSYKLQIKTKGKPSDAPTKENDIILIRLNPDLAVNSERGLIAPRIIEECIGEYDAGGDYCLSPKINERTDKLLEILG